MVADEERLSEAVPGLKLSEERPNRQFGRNSKQVRERLTPWPYKTGLKGVEVSEKALNVVYSMYKGIVSQQCCSKLLKMKKTVYSLIL